MSGGVLRAWIGLNQRHTLFRAACLECVSGLEKGRLFWGAKIPYHTYFYPCRIELAMQSVGAIFRV